MLNPVNVNEITCKTALSVSRLPGLTYSLNPYRGCQHACIYCYAPCVLKIHRNDWGHTIGVKKNIASVLAQELTKRKPGVVGLSTVTDPFQPLEKRYRLSRLCLEQLLHYDYPVCIQTKSSLVLRDSDVISRFSSAEVMVSIGTLDDHHRQILEPYASPIQDRLNTLKQYTLMGIRTSVFFGPIYPTITAEDIPKILDIFHTNGATTIWVDSLNLKPGILENINKAIMNHKNLSKKITKEQLENTKVYSHLRNIIHMEAKKKQIRIIDAF